MAGLRGFLRKNRGQGLVEFALVLPILLLLLLGIVEFARIYHVYLVTGYASREGARVAVVGADNDSIKEAARNAGVSINLADDDVTIAPVNIAARTSGETVTVTVTGYVKLIGPFVSKLFDASMKDPTDPNKLILVKSSVMRLE